MELHTDNQPHPWHYLALGLLCLLIALFATAVYVTGKSFTPQDFADARTIDALQTETLEHTQAMNDLTEQNQANALAHTAQRRQYLTWLTLGLAASLTGFVALLNLATTPIIITWSARRTIENLALLRQAWREIPNQPLPIALPGGYTALPPGLANYHVQDTRTGQTHRAADDVPASPHRTHLEQVDAVRESVEQVAKQDARGITAWLPGLLQTLFTTPPPHRPSKPLVFRSASKNQNQKTKK